MIQIRDNVFETNSSSTHSMTIVPMSEYMEWVENKDILFNMDINEFGTFVSREAAIEAVREVDKLYRDSSWYHPIETYMWYDAPDDDSIRMCKNIDAVPEEYVDKYLAYHRFYTYYEYEQYNELEKYSEKYETQSGDKIVVFGMYGMD